MFYNFQLVIMLLSFNLHVRLICAIKHLLTYLAVVILAAGEQGRPAEAGWQQDGVCAAGVCAGPWSELRDTAR